MNLQNQKQAVAEAALEYMLSRITPDAIIGIGTGSTADLFIDALAPYRERFAGTVASSVRSAERLKQHNIAVLDLNDVSSLEIYIDGADEINDHLQMIKGGGGALTREKIVAAVSTEFVCIADETKWVDTLGNFPLPIEVIPMAVRYVSSQIAELGGQPHLREGFVTDNGNRIIDVHGLYIRHAKDLEEKLNQIVGVVTSGLFAKRPADVLFLGKASGVDYVIRT